MTDTVWGAIIGAAAALIGVFSGAPIANWQETKQFKRTQQAAAYEEAQRFLYINGSSASALYSSQEYLHLLEAAAVKMALYASDEANALFDTIIDLTLDKSGELSDEDRSKSLTSSSANCKSRCEKTLGQNDRSKSSRLQAAAFLLPAGILMVSVSAFPADNWAAAPSVFSSCPPPWRYTPIPG